MNITWAVLSKEKSLQAKTKYDKRGISPAGDFMTLSKVDYARKLRLIKLQTSKKLATLKSF